MGCGQEARTGNVVPYALAGDRPGCILEPNSEAVIPEARCRAARQCLEGSESRNRLGGETHVAGFCFSCFAKESTRPAADYTLWSHTS